MMKRRVLKKVLAIVLTLAMIIPSVVLFKNVDVIAATQEEEIPEGYIPIYDISELYAIRNDLDGKYILMNDLDMSQDTDLYDVGNGWVPIDGFSGIFDGNGHFIKNMKIYGNVRYHAGLFGDCSGECKIKNLGMVDVDVNIEADTSDFSFGTIASCRQYDYSRSLEISNCFVTGKIQILCNEYDYRDDIFIGGLVGGGNYLAEVNLNNCYNSADINVKASSAGVAGLCGGDAIVVNCINQGNIMYNDELGTPISYYSFGHGTGYDYTNCFYMLNVSKNDSWATALTETQMKNKNFFTGFDFEDTWFIDPYSNYPHPQLKACPQQRIDSIEIVNVPTKTVYSQGDKLDCTGGIIKLIYEDGLEQEVLLTDKMLCDYDMTKIGMQKIPVIYCGIAETQFEIMVNEIPVESVQLNKNETTIYKGKSETLSATVLPENATNKDITWSVVSGDSVTVDNNGKVTANKQGISTVRATSQNGKYADCIVHVEIPCILLQLTNYNVTINKGDTSSVEDTIGYTMSPLDCTDTVTWKSSNDKVLMIDDNGIMTGFAAGTVTVIGTTSSGTTAMANVTVQRNINEFTVTGLSNKYYTGKAIKQKIAVSDGSTTLKENVDYKVSYQENVNVGTAKMKITGIAPYVGTIEHSFQILQTQEEQEQKQVVIKRPSKARIKSVTAGKKKLTVTWKKVSGARGYKVQFATNKKFSKGLKTYSVSSSTTKKVCKGLKKRKTYYVRVAAYCNNEEGTLLMGKYSSVKAKKTK